MAAVQPLAGYLRMSDADLAEIRHLVRIGALSTEQAKERERKGVLKQKEDILRLRDSLYPGRPIVWYEDNNLSAFKRNVRRKDFERMVKDLAVPAIGGILAYDIDRVYRQPRDLERVIDCYDKPGCTLVFHTLSGQNFDLTTADGRFSARIMVSVANKSSEDMSRRLKREMERKALAGEPPSGVAPFGWNQDGSLNLKETKALDTMGDMILKGDSVTTCMDWLREEGFVGRAGKPYTRQSVLRILINPRNAGIRVFRGEPLKGEDGQYVMGPWEVTPWSVDKWRAIKEAVEGRKQANRAKSGPPGNTVRSILSGILRCGECGTRMVAANTTRRYPKYRCAKDAGGCGNITISRPRSEDAIRGLVSDVLMASSAKKETETEGPQWDKAEELAALEKEFAELHALWKADEIKTTSYILGREKLEGEIDQLRGERAVALARPVKAPTIDTIKDGWDRLSIERQREVILSVLTAVMVAKGGKRIPGGGIDHERLTPVFKQA